MTLATATPVESMNRPDLLSQYREILRQSRQMTEAARDGDWDKLIELEQIRAGVNEALMGQERGRNNLLDDQSVKAELIRNILACDEETRLLIIPRQQELKAAVGSIDTEKKLQKAYAMTW